MSRSKRPMLNIGLRLSEIDATRAQRLCATVDDRNCGIDSRRPEQIRGIWKDHFRTSLVGERKRKLCLEIGVIPLYLPLPLNDDQ